MRFKNHWTDQVQQEVTVHLKKRGYKADKSEVAESVDVVTGKTEHLGCYEHFCDLEKDKPRSMTVKVNRYGLSYREKLGIVFEAALKEFSDDLNRHLEAFYTNAVYRGVPSDTEPAVVIDPKFLKMIAEGTQAFLDKNHTIQAGTLVQMTVPPASELQSLKDAKKSCPQFVNEKPPATRVMSDVKAWVIQKRAETK